MKRILIPILLTSALCASVMTGAASADKHAGPTINLRTYAVSTHYFLRLELPHGWRAKKLDLDSHDDFELRARRCLRGRTTGFGAYYRAEGIPGGGSVLASLRTALRDEYSLDTIRDSGKLLTRGRRHRESRGRELTAWATAQRTGGPVDERRYVAAWAGLDETPGGNIYGSQAHLTRPPGCSAAKARADLRDLAGALRVAKVAAQP